jgi:hypothetical protein
VRQAGHEAEREAAADEEHRQRDPDAGGDDEHRADGGEQREELQLAVRADLHAR